MGRLIDADELVEHIKILGIWDEVKNKDVFTNDIKDAILGLIGALPTAYDPDKVVEQLEELHERYLNEYGLIGNHGLSALNRAIEIVQGGGVDG